MCAILMEHLTREGSLNEVFEWRGIPVAWFWGISLSGGALGVSLGEFVTYMYSSPGPFTKI